MLTKLGLIIEKKPWFIVIIVILITIGFATLIPSIKMKTDMQEFMPDDELVQANTRINKYFGMGQQIMMLYVKKQRAESTIATQALREQHRIQKEIEKFSEVEGSFSITTLLDQICQLEFGKTLENSTDEQLNIALHDLIGEQEKKEIKMMNNDDPNEPVDYTPYPRISKGKSIDSLDIKNHYIKADDNKITFAIEVYDLSHFQSKLKPPHFLLNVMEWYIDFKNLVIPDERLDIDFKIAAHIEPTNPLWEIGKGPLKNLREIVQNLRKHELFNSYKKEVYLWIKPPGQTMYFPIPLETANVTFNIIENRISIDVSREELGKLGIAPRIGSIELPAKLGETRAGFRYYQTPKLKLPWPRLTINTSFLLNSIKKIRNRPILNDIARRILQRFGDFTWEDFDQLFEMMDQSGFQPDKIALKDMDTLWIQLDKAPDKGTAENIFFIIPYFIEEIKTEAVGFLSKDYQETNAPKASLIILQINATMDYDESNRLNREMVQRIQVLDKQSDFVSVEVTGEGVIQFQIDDLTTESNQIIAPAIFIVIMFILFINFRKISYVFLPLLSLTISIIWLFGTMVLLGMVFSAMAVAIIPLLMGLGVDYSVHLFHNYNAELEKGKTSAQAIKNSIKEIGTAMFLAMITTVIAFMSFLSAVIPPVRNIGVLVGIGIIYTFVTTITLLASVRYILDRKKKVKRKRKIKIVSVKNIMSKTSDVVIKRHRLILITAVLVSIIMAAVAFNLETGFNLEEFLPEDSPAIMTVNKISDDFPYAGVEQQYILIEGDVATVETLHGMRKTHENIRDDTVVARETDGNPKTMSILVIIQQAINNNKTLITRYNIDKKTGIPKTDEDVRQLYDYLYEDELYNIQVKGVLYKNNNRYEAALISAYVEMLSRSLETEDINQELRILKQELNEDIEDYGDASAIATGYYIIILTITGSLTTSQILSTAVSLFLAAIVLMIAYRKPLLGVITMIPVSISIIWILGTIYFLGYSLNIMTIMVTALTIGIGIDYAIHTTERFKLVADKTGDVQKAMSETIGHTGGALFIAALTTAAGFGILVFSPMSPQVQFGIITAMTITYSFLTSVLILPPVLVRWGKWRKKRKGYIISTRKYVKRDKAD